MDLSVSRLVDSLHESVNLLLGNLSASVHVLQGFVDQVGNLAGIQGVAVVLVELAENSINGVSELLIGIAHISKYPIIIYVV